MNSARALVIALAILAAGCGKSTENQLIGSWEGTKTISPEEFAKLSKTPLAPGLSIEMKADFVLNYRAEGKGDSEGTMNVTMKHGDREVLLSFRTKGAMTWEVEGDVITETVVDGTVIPIDAQTKAFTAKNPETLESLRPIKGKSMPLTILGLTPASVELEVRENGLRYSMQRKAAP